MSSDLPLILSVIAVLFSGITAILSLLAYANVIGLKNSTHQIQYVEADGPTGKELADQFKDMYSDVENEYV